MRKVILGLPLALSILAAGPSFSVPASNPSGPRGLRVAMGKNAFLNPNGTLADHRLFTFSGQPFQGDISQSFTYTPYMWQGGGYNLIPNPYPSAIDWEKIWDDVVDTTKLRNEHYIYDPNLKQYGRYDGVNDLGTLGTSRLIASGQSIFVRAQSGPGNTQNSGTMTITESHKATPSGANFSGLFLRTGKDESPSQVQRRENTMWIRLNSSPFQGGDECVLIFRPGADQLFVNGEDGEALEGTSNFSTLSDDDVKCDVNVYPAFFFNWQVKCRFKAPGGSTFTVKIDSLESFPAGSRFFLQDKKCPNGLATRDSLQDLLISNIYSFRYDGANVADEDRFVLHCIAPNVAVQPSLPGSVAVPLGALLFPNPATTSLTVRLSGSRGKAAYSMFSSTGAIVLTGRAEGSSFSLDVQSLPKGMYLVRVEENGRSVTRRFVKE